MQHFSEVECCQCGILFKTPRSFLDTKRENGAKFFCPNGHELSFTKRMRWYEFIDVNEVVKALQNGLAYKEELEQRRALDH